MNGRAVSLPDLVTEKRRNTCLSLTEGFSGARHEGSLAATAQNWCPRPGAGGPFVGQKDAGAELSRVLPIYYRTRQMALGTEKDGKRLPSCLANDLRAVEKALAREIRPTHPLFFQRFDELQLDRLLRAMPFLKLSSGRWIYGAESLGAQWPATSGDRAFLLLQGHVTLYQDPAGIGEKVDVYRGSIFGEKRFWLGDEGMRDHVANAAHCEEPCIVGMITTQALEAAYSDRAFGNFRIAQSMRIVPSLSAVCFGEKIPATRDPSSSPGSTRASTSGGSPPMRSAMEEDKEHFAAAHGLRDLSKVATALHVHTGEEVLSNEPLEASVLVISKGSLEVRGDITLTEKLESLPQKRVRMHVFVDRCEDLAGGGSFFDKMDPYVVCKLGERGKFQTPTIWGGGGNPKIEYKGCFAYNDEDTLEISVWDCDRQSADDLCGSGTIDVKELKDGYKGAINLYRQKRGIFSATDNMDPEFAGKVHIRVRYDYEKANAFTKKPKSKSWPDMELFLLEEQDCWGHEHIMLREMFLKTLEGATSQLAYKLELTNIRVLGATRKGGNQQVSLWKASKQRFMEFVKATGREKQLLQACRVSALEKQTLIRNMVKRLIKKWEIEEETDIIRRGLGTISKGSSIKSATEAIDPGKFRIAYRGYKAHIEIRSAINLVGSGFMGKADPYVQVRFRGSRQTPLHSSILQDPGPDPVWECDGELLYSGETALEICVLDYDRNGSHTILGTGVIMIEAFCKGFEGMVQLSSATKKKTMKPTMITIGVVWPPLEQQPMNPSTTWGTSATGAIVAAASTWGAGKTFGAGGSFTGFGKTVA